MATSGSRHAAPQRHLGAAVIVLLFGLFYVHIRLGVNPALIYHNERPVFLTGMDFLRDLLSKPGGLVEYISLFCGQFCHYPWAGALVITALAGLICLATRGVLTSVGRAKPHPAACLAPLLLVMLVYSRYGADLGACVQIVAVLWLVSLYAHLPWRGRLSRLAGFMVMSAATYYLTGSGYVLFAALCGIVELLGRRQAILGLLFILCAPVPPCALAAYSYEASYPEVFAPLLPVGKKIVVALAPPFALRTALHLGLVTFFPAAAIWAGLHRQRVAAGLAIRRLLSALRPPSRHRRVQKATPSQPARSSTGWKSWPIAVLIVLTAVAAAISVDKLTKALIEIDYAVHNKMWQHVLDKAAILPPDYQSIYVMNAVNTALHNTGRLPYEMFAHPQRADRDSVFFVFFMPPGEQDTYERFSEVLYDLGFMNESEHFAHEALERHGPLPAILQRLAKINIVKGLPSTARTFLGALGRNLLYQKWAKEYLRKLEDAPLMNSDTELNDARARMIRAEYTIGAGVQDEEMGPLLVRALESKLQADMHSKTAFEYLMAHYLLTGQLDKVVANIPRLSHLGYRDIPRHYQEAILLHASTHPDADPQLDRISPQTLDSFRAYIQVLARFRNDKSAANRELMKTHDRSYFLYYTVGFSDSRFAAMSNQTGAPR